MMTADLDNPLSLGLEYAWQMGDTFMLIAHKYRRIERWIELLDLNKTLLSRNHYHMREGDIIKIPEDWFPLPTLTYDTQFTGSHGTRRI